MNKSNQHHIATLRTKLDEVLSDAFAACGYKGVVGDAVRSQMKGVHFQSNNSFAVAKQAAKAPLHVAEEVVENLQGNDMFSSVQAAAPGFINIVLADAYLAEHTNAGVGTVLNCWHRRIEHYPDPLRWCKCCKAAACRSFAFSGYR